MITNVSILKSNIKTIGKSKFYYDDNLGDYKYNNSELSNIKIDFYSKLRNQFNEKIGILLSHNKVNQKLLKDLINLSNDNLENIRTQKNHNRVASLLDKKNPNFDDYIDKTHANIRTIMDVQQFTLKNILKFLIQLSEELDYLVPDDLKEIKIDVDSEESELINLQGFGKATINLRKKDAISLLLMLEHVGVIDFSESNKNKFIEQNFNYQHNNGIRLPISQINSEISNLKDMKNYGTRNKGSYKRLNTNLIKLIEGFDFKELVSKMN